MATMNVKDASGATVAIEKPLPPGRAAALESRPVALSTEDKAAIDALATDAKQDVGNDTLASILGKLTSDPATAAGQAAIISAIGGISPGGGSGGDASAANQESQITQETAINTVLGTKTDAKSAATDATAVSHTSILKQQSEYLKALGEVQTTPTANTLLDRLKTVGTQVTALNTVLGVKTDAKSTATDATSVTAMQVIKQISASVQSALTTAIAAGSNLIGKVKISDGTNDAAVKAGSTSPALTDPAVVVVIRPDSLGDPFSDREPVAASQTAQMLGTTGAIGDYLAGVTIVPEAADCGAVYVKDGSNAALKIFDGGGTIPVPSPASFTLALGWTSKSGGWQITTGAGVTAVGTGKFT